MSDESYERLAGALDAPPNGFPRVPSGAEIKLLKKAFTSEEVELALRMSRAYRTVETIAARAGIAEERAKELLEGLRPRGLVRKPRGKALDSARVLPGAVGEKIDQEKS